MLTEYIRVAMRNAKYDILEEDGSFYGRYPVSREYGQTSKSWRAAGRSSRKCWNVGSSLASPKTYLCPPRRDLLRGYLDVLMPVLGPITRRELISQASQDAGLLTAFGRQAPVYGEKPNEVEEPESIPKRHR